MAGSVDAQIAKLREIDGNIRPEDRPEWFTTEWIDQAEQAMGTPADGGIEDALDAALSGQYAAFENAIIGYIDAHDPDAGTSENGASQFAGYEITDRAGNDSPTSYRLDWFDDEGLVREGPKVTVKELTRMREGIFGSPDSWDSFGTTPSTSSAARPTWTSTPRNVSSPRRSSCRRAARARRFASSSPTRNSTVSHATRWVPGLRRKRTPRRKRVFPTAGTA